MTRFTTLSAIAVALGAPLTLIACGGDDLTCGSGTKKKGSECVATSSGSGGEGGTAGAAGAGGGQAGAGGAAGSGGGVGGSAGGGNVDMAPTFAGVQAVAPASETSLQVSWAAASDDNTAEDDIVYNIYVASTAGDQNFGAPTFTAPPGSRAFIMTNQAPGAEVHVVVRAVDGAGNEDTNTNEVSAAPALDSTAPTFAGATGASGQGATEVEVSWDAATDDPNDALSVSYLVYWSDIQGNAKNGLLGASSSPGETSAVVKGLPAADTEFYFHVVAVDASGNTDDNDVEVAGTTGGDATPPTFGGCTSVSNVTASGATLTWSPAKDDVTASDLITYNVYAETGEIEVGDPLGAPLGSFTGGTQGTIQGLLPGESYSFICRAADATGNEDNNYAIRLGDTLTDGIAPTFSGLTAATFNSTEIELTWNAASDDQTAEEDIVYAAYVATTAGAQDFMAATQLSTPGATGMTVGGLDSNTDFFIVVRARDQAGNEDANANEAQGKTLVSFALDIQPIFTENCALMGCHVPGDPPQGQILSEGFAYSNIVNVPSGQPDPRLRIDQSSTDPMDSYLYIKISQASPPFGSLMPPAVSGRVLTAAQIQTVSDWISEGALEN